MSQHWVETARKMNWEDWLVLIMLLESVAAAFGFVYRNSYNKALYYLGASILTVALLRMK